MESDPALRHRFDFAQRAAQGAVQDDIPFLGTGSAQRNGVGIERRTSAMLTSTIAQYIAAQVALNEVKQRQPRNGFRHKPNTSFPKAKAEVFSLWEFRYCRPICRSLECRQSEKNPCRYRLLLPPTCHQS